MHVYVFWRAATIPAITHHVSVWFLAALAAILWASFLLPRFLNIEGANVFARMLEYLGTNWLGILFLIFCCLLVVDIITAFGFLFHRQAATLRGLALLTGVALSLIALIQGHRPPVVNDYEVHLQGLSPEDDGLILVAISDLHISATLNGDWLAARVSQVNALNPNVIVITGDIIEGHGHPGGVRNLVPVLRGFSAPLGVWAVTGNHESFASIDSSVQLLEDADIHVLRNQWCEAKPGFVIAGIDDPRHFRRAKSPTSPIKQALSGRPAGVATVFLSHRPEQAEVAAAAGAGLMFSGHTHGGQIWPFTYVAAAANSLLAGWYEVDGMPIIVSRGTGTWGPRMRLWSPGEILRITLRVP